MFCSYNHRLYSLKINIRTYSKIAAATTNKLQKDKAFIKYFKDQAKTSLFDLFPKNILARTKKASNVYYLAGNDSAEKIAAVLNKSSDSPIIEINPGIGVLTNYIQESNRKTQDVKLIEVNKTLFNHLRISYGGQLSCHHDDFCGLWRSVFLDKRDNGNRAADLLDLLPKNDWKSEPASRIVVHTGSLEFYKNLIFSFSAGSSLFSHSRHEIFTAIPPSLYFLLTSTNENGYFMYRSISVIFQILFEFEFITKLDRHDFLPWPSRNITSKRTKLRELKTIDNDCFYFVRIVPRKHIFDYCTRKEMNMLKFFVKQNFMSRKNRIIPAIERYIPYAGKQLILEKRKPETPIVLYDNESLPEYRGQCFELSSTDFYPDLNIFTEFGDLSPNQIFTLFNSFKKLEGFKESAFTSNMEQQLMKEETTEEG